MRLGAGPFIAHAAVQNDKTAEAVREFFNEFAAMRKPIPRDDLAKARNYVALRFPQLHDHAADRGTPRGAVHLRPAVRLLLTLRRHPPGGERHRRHILLYPGGISETEILFPYGAARFASKVGQLAGNHFLTVREPRQALREMREMVLWRGAQHILFEETG